MSLQRRFQAGLSLNNVLNRTRRFWNCLNYAAKADAVNGQLRFRTSLAANGTRSADIHTQIASRFEQMELPVWTESDELRRFVAGYLVMLPIRKNSAAIDQQFIEYVLALTDGVTGRIIDLLRRAAVDALGHKSKSVGIEQLLIAGAYLPAIINQRCGLPERPSVFP